MKSTNFGKVFTLPVDGRVDAQPLVVSGLSVPGYGSRNVVLVVTEHDGAYAFDTETAQLYWHVSLLKSGETTSDTRGCGQVSPEIGITSTPVIDPAAGPHGTIYIVAMSKSGSTSYFQRLHALDLTTGVEQFQGPVDIHATYPGTGDNSTNGTVTFDPKQYKERAGLLLVNGIVYTSWASHCDIRPYTGWVIGYDRLSLSQTSVFNFTPNGHEAAIWASGAGPAADPAGNLYFSLGNGTFDTTLTAGNFPSRGDYGNAFVKLGFPGGVPTVADYWTMFNTLAESNADQDLGSGGILLLPDLTDGIGGTRHLAVGAGKDRNIYVLDRDNMGKFSPASNMPYQVLPTALTGGEYAMPAWFSGKVYFGSVGDHIRAFQVSAAMLSATPTSITSTSFTYPGATPSISANGAQSGIVWAVENSSTAVLHAYDALDLATELYNSNQAANNRDHFGAGNKYITPTIANGKVFVGTPDSVVVFGVSTADLTVSNTHRNSFRLGETGAQYGITVTNSGIGPTGGVVSVTDSLPAGLHATAMSGTGWVCVVGAVTCTRNDPLAAGSSYPPIALTVDVALNAPALLTTTATVSGGGEVNTANNTARDSMAVKPNHRPGGAPRGHR